MPAGANGQRMSSLRTDALAPIAEWAAPSPDQFRAEILSSEQPAMLRGIARDWPLVLAARQDAHKAMSLLEAGANARLTNVLRADPEEEGRFHYARDVRSFNFIRGEGNVAGIIAGLREEENRYPPSSIAAQGLDAERYFPGFAQTHPMPLVPPASQP